MLELSAIKKITIPEGEVERILDRNGNTLWRYELSCTLYSSMSETSSILTSYYGESILSNDEIQNPIIDEGDTRQFQNKWYRKDEQGNVIILTYEELEHFKLEDAKLYPLFQQLLSVNVYTITDKKEQISAFQVIENEYIPSITIPTKEHYNLSSILPQGYSQVPITADTDISIYYTPNKYEVNLQLNESEKGELYGEGKYSYGSNAVISVSITDDRYVFNRWSDGNIDNPRTILIDGPKDLTAYISTKSQMNYHMNIPITITYRRGY